MKSVSPIRLKGSLEMVLRKEDGEVTVTRKDNLIVDVGFDFVSDAIGNGGARPGVMSHIAVGTGAVAPAAGDTTLGTELFRKSATYSHTPATKVFSFATTLSAGEGTGAITEAGVFNAASSGIMFDRVTFPVVNKGAGDTLQATFTFTMS